MQWTESGHLYKSSHGTRGAHFFGLEKTLFASLSAKGASHGQGYPFRVIFSISILLGLDRHSGNSRITKYQN